MSPAQREEWSHRIAQALRARFVERLGDEATGITVEVPRHRSTFEPPRVLVGWWGLDGLPEDPDVAAKAPDARGAFCTGVLSVDPAARPRLGEGLRPHTYWVQGWVTQGFWQDPKRRRGIFAGEGWAREQAFFYRRPGDPRSDPARAGRLFKARPTMVDTFAYLRPLRGTDPYPLDDEESSIEGLVDAFSVCVNSGLGRAAIPPLLP